MSVVNESAAAPDEEVEQPSQDLPQAPPREINGEPSDVDPESEESSEEPDDADPEVPEDPLVQLEKARAESLANHDRYVRAVAELENFRKRTVRARGEAREEALRDILLQIAPVLDNIRRALAEGAGDADEAGALRQGVQLIYNQFQSILKGYGLEEIVAMGEPFDPNLHEAMMEVPSADHSPGTVMEEMDKGYMLRGRVVRPSRVVVSKAVEESEDG